MGDVIEVDRETRRVVRALGRPDDPGVDLEVVVRKYDLPDAFSTEVLAEADAVAGAGLENPGERDDLRDWTCVTIDGADARDFDDAVSIRGKPPVDIGEVLRGRLGGGGVNGVREQPLEKIVFLDFFLIAVYVFPEANV